MFFLPSGMVHYYQDIIWPGFQGGEFYLIVLEVRNCKSCLVASRYETRSRDLLTDSPTLTTLFL